MQLGAPGGTITTSNVLLSNAQAASYTNAATVSR